MEFLPLPLLAVFAFILGTLIGSFLNVVIYRVPAGVSVVFPRSRCPNCGHTLSALELIPIASWAAQGGKCRNCQAPISPRYAVVEGLTGLLFLGAALIRPVFPDLLLIWAFMALLVALSFIDFDTKTLPNSLNFGGLALGLVGAAALAYPLPSFSQALDAAFMGAGVIALFAGFGGLIYNRFRNSPAAVPVGQHQVHLAAMFGAIGGMVGTAGGVWLGVLGILAGALSWMLSARTGKPSGLHDGITLGIAAVTPFIAWAMGGSGLALESARGMLISTGAVALAAMIYWWIRNPSDKVTEEDHAEDPGGYVTVMGYGDVVLAGFLGAWLGFANFGAGIFLAVFAGAILGLIVKRVTGESTIPFGPYLAIGGLVAFFYGEALIGWYLGYIGAR